MQKFAKFFWSSLPTKLISSLVGKFSKTRISRHLINLYIRIFSIDLEPLCKKQEDFSCLCEFFIRELKSEVRPIAPDKNAAVSPVDGLVTAVGDVTAGQLIQAKNFKYSTQELLGAIGPYSNRFNNSKFATIYLSPRDYHRIHAPLSGKIVASTYVSGKLLPVNTRMLNIFPALFAGNERLISYLETDQGLVAIIKVGATNVGSIKVNYDQRLKTNQDTLNHKECTIYENPITVAKGEELGYFELGSTVILLFEKLSWDFSINQQQHVIMGEIIARHNELGNK